MDEIIVLRVVVQKIIHCTNLIVLDNNIAKIHDIIILHYNITLIFMTTLSVPVPARLEELVKKIAKQRGSNKAEVVRHALELLAEEEAVLAVLKAEQEPTLHGSLKKLARKIK